MPCYRPLKAYRTASGAVSFTELRRDNVIQNLNLPCGQCVGCRLERSRQWAVRCMHEAQLHPHNSFVTLTYDDEHLPPHNSLRHRDFQLFIKRVRKALSKETAAQHGGQAPHTPVLRYYMAGEYGETFHRPHYHACLFGIDWDDKVLFSENKGNRLYTSKTLTDLWGLGHATTGELTFETAAYTARYVMKKVTGQRATFHYEITDPDTGEVIQRQAEYNKMSLKPGIGADWIKKYERDVYPQGKVVVRGHESRAPKYYDKLHKRSNPDEHEELQWTREKEGRSRAEHNTDARLAVREKVATAKLKQMKRTLQ